MPNQDRRFMSIALDLAEQGHGKVEPNPPVGALVVKDREIIGRGHHEKFGGSHAEVQAIEDAGGPDACKGGTLYVTLEPCNHTGKTPPCTKAIIEAGFARVAYSVADPNPANKTSGTEALRKAGISVTTEILMERGEELLRDFLCVHRNGRPYVLAKWAMSLDGRIATYKGDSKWITSAHARQIARHTRSQYQGIMVGINTVLKDNPRLTTQEHPDTGIPPIHTPVRLIMDRNGRIPRHATVVETAEEIPTWIVSSTEGNKSNLDAAEQAGCKVLRLEHPHFKNVMRELANAGIQSVMIEGGAQVLGSAFRADCVDEVMVFIAPKIVGGKNSISAVQGEDIETIQEAILMSELEAESIGTDLLLRGHIRG